MKYSRETLKAIFRRVLGSMSGMSNTSINIVDNIIPHYEPDKDSIFMPPICGFANDDEEDFAINRGVMIHETGHVLFAPDFVMLNKIPFNTIQEKADFFEWANVFMDANNEFKTVEIWPHLKKPLSDKATKLIDKHPEILKTDNPMAQALLRIYPLADLKAEYPKNMDKELIKFVDETVEDYKKSNGNTLNGEELIGLVVRTSSRWNKYKKDFNQTTAPNSRMNQLLKQLGEAIKAKDAASCFRVQEEINKLNSEKRKWHTDKVDKRLLNPISPSHKGLYQHMDIEDLKKKLKKHKAVLVDGNKAAPEIMGDVNAIKVPDSKITDLKEVRELYVRGKTIHQILKNKVKLQDNYESRQMSGSVDMNEVRRQVGQMGQIGQSSIFKRNNDFTRGGEWACQVLIDVSGSMQGEKILYAREAMTTLAYALDGLPNVKYELLGFSASREENKIWIIKSFKEKKAQIGKIYSLEASGGTPTAVSINYGMKSLMKIRGKKLMIVITDGTPDNPELCIKAVKNAEMRGIKVIGIAVGDIGNEIRKYFKNYYVLDQNSKMVSELTPLILAQLGQRSQLSSTIKRDKRLYFTSIGGGKKI